MTPWVPITPNSDFCSALGSGQEPRYRIEGDVLRLVGAFRLNAPLTPGSTLNDNVLCTVDPVPLLQQSHPASMYAIAGEEDRSAPGTVIFQPDGRMTVSVDAGLPAPFEVVTVFVHGVEFVLSSAV